MLQSMGSQRVRLDLESKQQKMTHGNFYAEYIIRNAGLEETQAGIKIAGKNSNNLR